mgnify:CR=1 FL=1
MPKMKTNRSAAKRFSKTGSGKLTHKKGFKNHILTKKATKRKRQLRGFENVSPADVPALRRMLPPLVGQFVSVIKDSCLVSVIAVSELTKEAQNAITVHFRSFETWIFVAFLYFVVNTTVSSFGRFLEKRLAVGTR